MDGGERERAKAAFLEVCDLAPAERAARLDALCAGDARLRARVERLIEANARSSDVLGPENAPPWRPAGALRRAAEVLASADSAPADLAPGDRVGSYRILRKAGSGGFGTVYLAEQDAPVSMRVALKILRTDLDSVSARARFDAERQALALMEHPGIARVLDAGATAQGRPYFAMEFVPGAPITEYCQQRRMGLRARLELFRTVCQAVQHAHQKGVVHRDLKPSNVLVTEVDGMPLPKVIDFGVAKAMHRRLTDLSLVSIEGQLMGTPAYMSPEQTAGDLDVDTGTDVYALGALLYELLSGVPPFDAQELGFAALLRAIAEEDPPRPSQRAARERLHSGPRSAESLPPDLDWIAMRCLEKERSRRYPSANALALDVERFLDGHPVEAAPPSRSYRLRKLARRHRLAVASVVALLVALVAGALGTGVGLVRANRANARLTAALTRASDEADRAQRAETRAAEEAENAREQWLVAQAVNEFLTEDLLGAAAPSNQRGEGRDVSLREVLDVASERIETAGMPGGRFAEQPLVEASIRHMIGDVYAALGRLEQAAGHLRRALELRERELGAEHPDTLRSAARLAAQLSHLGSHDEAQARLLATLETQRRVLGASHGSTLLTERELAMLRYRQGRVEEAYQLVRAAYERGRETLAPEGQVNLALLGSLAILTQASGRDVEAETYLRASYERRREALGADHPDTVASMINLASYLRAFGRYGEAGELLERAYRREVEILGPEHPSTATALFNLGALAEERGDSERAEELLRETLARYTSAYGPGHPSTLQTEAALARALESLGRRAEAEGFFRHALAGTRETLGPDHPTTDSRRKDLAGFLFHEPAGVEEELRALLEESLESQSRMLGPEHPNTLRATANLGTYLQAAGDLEGAERLLREALAGFRARSGPDFVEVLATESDLAGVYLDSGRPAEAEALARHTVEVGERTLSPETYDLSRFRLRLGLALRDLGRTDEAREQIETAHEVLVRTRGEQDALSVFAAEALAELGVQQ